MSDARDLLELMDRRIERALPPRALGRVVGVVQSVIPSLRVVQALLDGATTPVSVAYPALPVEPVAGDSVAIERSRDGWLMVSLRPQVTRRSSSATGSVSTSPGVEPSA